PTPEIMAGNFTTDNANNRALCRNGCNAKPTGSFPQGGWCNDLSGTVFPDGSSIPVNNDKVNPSFGLTLSLLTGMLLPSGKTVPERSLHHPPCGKLPVGLALQPLRQRARLFALSVVKLPAMISGVG